MSVCMSVCLCVFLSVYLSLSLSVYLSVCLSVSLSLSLSVPLSLSFCLSLCQLKSVQVKHCAATSFQLSAQTETFWQDLCFISQNTQHVTTVRCHVKESLCVIMRVIWCQNRCTETSDPLQSVSNSKMFYVPCELDREVLSLLQVLDCWCRDLDSIATS